MNRKALLIANDKYNNPLLSQLEAVVQDGTDLKRVLADKEIGNFDCTLLPNTDSSHIRQVVEKFYKKSTEDDLLLFYFSGHGIKDEQNKLFLACPDTNLDYLNSSSLESNFIQEQMRLSPSNRQVILLDCCHSGAFAKGTKSVGQRIGTAAAFEGRGHSILTASDAIQYAFEGEKIIGQPPRSVFTDIIVRGLETGQADFDNNGTISFEDLFQYVVQQTKARKVAQTPHKWQLEVHGEIKVAQNRFWKLKPFPDGLHEAIQSKLARVRMVAVEELLELMQRTPDARDAAREALERLANDADDAVAKYARNIRTGRDQPPATVSSGKPSIDEPVRLAFTLAGQQDIILRVSWRQDGRQMATTSTDRTAGIWDEKGKCLATLRGHGQGVNAVAWSHDYKFLATCSYDSRIKIWDCQTWTESASFQAHDGDVCGVAWSPDGKFLASCGEDTHIKLWKPPSPTLDAWSYDRTFSGHEEGVNRVLWSQNGQWLYSSSVDCTVRAWSLFGQEDRTIEVNRRSLIDLALSPDGQWLGWTSFDGSFAVWDIENWRLLTMSKVKTGYPRGISFSPDNSFLAVDTLQDRRGNIELWNTKQWKRVWRWPVETSNFWPCNLAWAPKSNALATLSDTDRLVKVYEIDSDALNAMS